MTSLLNLVGGLFGELETPTYFPEKVRPLVPSDRRRREDGARRAYLQRQAEGLLDASAHEFQAVSQLVSWRVAHLYVVKRREKLSEEVRRADALAHADALHAQRRSKSVTAYAGLSANCG